MIQGTRILTRADIASLVTNGSFFQNPKRWNMPRAIERGAGQS